MKAFTRTISSHLASAIKVSPGDHTTRALALPYHPQDWFSRLQTTKYQQLMPDPFDVIHFDMGMNGNIGYT